MRYRFLRMVSSSALAALMLVACTGTTQQDPGASVEGSTRAPVPPVAATSPTTTPVTGAAPLVLSVFRNCFSAEVWAFSEDDTLGVGVKVSAEHRSSNQPTTYALDASQLAAYAGDGLAMQFCAGTGAPHAETLDVVSGSGSLTLDPLGQFPGYGHLATSELLLSNGIVVAPLDVEATCIDCRPS